LPLPLSLPLHLPLLLSQPSQFCHPEQSEGPAVAFAFPIQNAQICHPEQSEGPAVAFAVVFAFAFQPPKPMPAKSLLFF
jgi:hypothetical protein